MVFRYHGIKPLRFYWNILVLKYQGVNVSGYQISGYQNIWSRVSVYLGINVSRCQGIDVSGYQDIKV